jgi:prepilin-type N-terminal cleavage/methylation domain-containing protein
MKKFASFISNSRKKQRAFLANEAGFSLLEMALVLAILGVLGGLTLPLLTTKLDHKKAALTHDHQDAVLLSLAGFLLKNARLPCPAKNKEEGLEQPHCLSASEAIGYIPFKTLGLPASYAQDGFRHSMIYAVEPKLTATDRLEGDQSYCTLKGSTLTLSSEAHFPLMERPRDFVAVVLASVEASQTPSHFLNSNHLVFTTPRPSSHREEKKMLLKWVSRDNLLALYGRAPCKPASLR